MHLKLCDLTINNLSIASIHDLLRTLTNLQIGIYPHRTVEVPDWVGQLPKLHRLKLAHNKIKTLPESFFSDGRISQSQRTIY